MSGIDNNTLLYLRGDSFKDLSPANTSIIHGNVFARKGDKFSNTYIEFNNTSISIKDQYLNLGKLTVNLKSAFTIDFMLSLNAIKTGMDGIFTSNGEGGIWSDVSNAWIFGVDDGYLFFTHSSIDPNKIFTSSTKLEANRFYHIQLTRSGSYMYLFIDGVQDKKVSVSSYSFVNTMCYLGRSDARGCGAPFKISNFRISNIARNTTKFTPPTYFYNSIDLSITNQTEDKIDFTVSKVGQETINKVEVVVNNQVSKTYDNIGDLAYNIDKSLLFNGNNKIKIKVTFDNDYTEEKEINYEYKIDKLSTSSSLKELIDRQELLTNSIEVQKKNLKSILESKNVVVSEEENKMSILIDKVNEFDEVTKPLYLYNYGEFFPNFFMENTYASGGAVTLNIDNISFKCNSSVSRSGLIYISTKAIDLSKYNFLYFKYKVTSFNGNGHLYVGTYNNKISDPQTGGVAEYYQRIENGKVALNTEIIGKVDISTIQSGYIALRSWNGAGLGPNLEFYQIWLEP